MGIGESLLLKTSQRQTLYDLTYSGIKKKKPKLIETENRWPDVGLGDRWEK